MRVGILGSGLMGGASHGPELAYRFERSAEQG
jgi:hypothetical protein